MNEKPAPLTAIACALAAVTVPSVFCCVGYFTGVLGVTFALLSLARIGKTPSLNRTLSIGALIVSLVAMLGHMSMMAVTDILSTNAASDEQAKTEAAKNAAAAATAAREKALLDAAPSLAATTTAALAVIDAKFGSGDVVGARDGLRQIDAQLAPSLALSPIPAPILAVNLRLAARKSYAAAVDAVERGDSHAENDVIGADAAYAEAVPILQTLTPEFVQAANPKIDLAAVTARRAKIAKRLKAEQRRVAKEKADEAAAAQAAAAIQKICGDAPQISPWDGGIYAVAEYMKTNANDPDSIEVTECSSPRLTTQCWRSTCKVRGKNGFGALILNQYTFYLGQNPQFAGMSIVLGMDQ